MVKHKSTHELLKLKNVGNATYQDLLLLGVNSIHELANAQADNLYIRLEKMTGRSHDPCVWDVFAAIIHEAKISSNPPAKVSIVF